jgi:hypothetical protein
MLRGACLCADQQFYSGAADEYSMEEMRRARSPALGAQSVHRQSFALYFSAAVSMVNLSRSVVRRAGLRRAPRPR